MLTCLHGFLGPSGPCITRLQALRYVGKKASSSAAISQADAFSLLSSPFSLRLNRHSIVSTHLTSPKLGLAHLMRSQRPFSTNIHCPLPSTEFYNRKKELDALERVITGKPQISVISGPINSGKTTLILHLLERLSKTNPTLYFDLRERNFSNVAELNNSLQISLSSWMDACKRTVEQPTVGPNVQLGKGDQEEKPPIEELNDLFVETSRQLSTYGVLSRKQSPILFIDEATRLKSLLNEDEGPKALSHLFEWFIKNTKQDCRFHVILGTSDSFFPLWIAQQISASRFTTYVIGNLSEIEAKSFWEERLLTQRHLLENLPAPSFDEAYKACGGNIYLLEKYFSEYCQLKGALSPWEFSVVGAERTNLVSALRKSRSADQPPSSSSIPWSREEYLEILRMLVAAKNNFLFYEDLCTQMDERIVNALIEKRILHLRPTESFSYDIPGHGTRPILTAVTPSSLLAMKAILRDVQEGKLQTPSPLGTYSWSSERP